MELIGRASFSQEFTAVLLDSPTLYFLAYKMQLIRESKHQSLFYILFILISFQIGTCVRSPVPIEEPSEWLTLPTQYITAEISVDLGVFFPNPESKIQAVGNPNQREDNRRSDQTAYLLNATQLPTLSLGYHVLHPGMGRNYGTYELVELIRQVADRFESAHPGREFWVGDLSQKNGGTIRDKHGNRAHSSHRNGLDADINFLRTDCKGTDSWHHPECPLEIKKNLDLVRMFVTSGPEMSESIVDRIYVSRDFKNAACRYVQASSDRKDRYGEVLRYLQVRSGHLTHFHIRIKCPPLSVNCPVSRPLSTRNPCS